MNFHSVYKKQHELVRVLIYLGINYGFIFIVQIVSGFIASGNALITNCLLCLLLILFTAIILKWERLSWKEIGCEPGNKTGLKEFFCGTLYGIIMLISVALTIKWLTGFHWELNAAFRWAQFIPILITVFASVLVQELAFRGYPFHLLLKKWGEWPAQIIISLLFGCMHLSDTMSTRDILLTMLTTGMGSLLFGIAVIKTGRIHLAVGIHFGWNFLQFLLPRSAMENGKGIWLVSGGTYRPGAELLIWVLPYMLAALSMFFFIRTSVGKRSPGGSAHLI